MSLEGLLAQPVTHEWATPQDFFDLLDEEFSFVQDVAANADNAKCASFITMQENGLTTPWSREGWVWCNPPYGDQMPKWVRKAHEEMNRGVRSVLLLPARVDTGWFHNHVFGVATELRIVRGRLSFGNAGSAPFPSMVVVYDKHARSQKTCLKTMERRLPRISTLPLEIPA